MIRRLWTPEEEYILTERYSTSTAEEIAAKLDRTISQVYNKAKALGLKKDPEFIREMGRRYAQHPESVATRFQRGHVSANKGKKMDPAVYEKVKGTMFKKGYIPKNTQPVGTEVVRGDGYLWRKTGEPKEWKQVHRILWEQHYGPIPAGSIVSFKNKNRLDIRIENLYLISRAEQLKTENSITARYPEELREVIRLKATIKRRINNINRNKNEEHQS